MQPSLSQVLITGVYRSGTEYVSQLVSGHPALSCTMYHVNGARFIRGRFTPLNDDANLRDAIGEMMKRLWVRYGQSLDADYVYRRCAEANNVTWQSLYDAIMSTLWLRDGKSHWAEKCQLVWSAIPEFVTGMPNGRAIIVIRDPRSVVASFKAYTYAKPPAYLGAIFNCLDAMAKAQEYEKTLPKDRFLTVRYEDAARDPKSYCARILAFIGLDPLDTQFNPDNWRDAHGGPWAVNSAFHDAGKTFDIGASVHRWKTNLDAIDIDLTEAVCGDVMTAFGYEPGGKIIDWNAARDRVKGDRAVTAFLQHYLNTREGVEAFPTDPHSSANWEERTLTS